MKISVALKARCDLGSDLIFPGGQQLPRGIEGGSWLKCLCCVPLPVSAQRRRSRLSQRKVWRNSRRKQRKLQRRLRNRPNWSVFFSSGLLFHIRHPLLQLLDFNVRFFWALWVYKGCLPTVRERLYCLSIPVILILFMSTQTKCYVLLHWMHGMSCRCSKKLPSKRNILNVICRAYYQFSQI